MEKEREKDIYIDRNREYIKSSRQKEKENNWREEREIASVIEERDNDRNETDRQAYRQRTIHTSLC